MWLFRIEQSRNIFTYICVYVYVWEHVCVYIKQQFKEKSHEFKTEKGDTREALKWKKRIREMMLLYNLKSKNYYLIFFMFKALVWSGGRWFFLTNGIWAKIRNTICVIINHTQGGYVPMLLFSYLYKLAFSQYCLRRQASIRKEYIPWYIQPLLLHNQ